MCIAFFFFISSPHVLAIIQVFYFLKTDISTRQQKALENKRSRRSSYRCYAHIFFQLFFSFWIFFTCRICLKFFFIYFFCRYFFVLIIFLLIIYPFMPFVKMNKNQWIMIFNLIYLVTHQFKITEILFFFFCAIFLNF